MILPAQAQIPVERIGWALLHFLWQGTVIAILYAFLRRLLRHSLSAPGRYLLASSALLAMAACPVITFLLNSDASGGTAALPVSLAAPQRVLNLVVALWLTGVLAFTIRLAGGWWYAARLRSIANPASSEWHAILRRIAMRVGAQSVVQLLVSPLVQVPTVIGWLRPAILLPVDLLAGLPAGHVEALLAHELAHIRRHDYLANVLQGIAETVLFYHPAVWWISEQIRTEREQCCDDLAVAAAGDALVYAQALAQLELRQPRRWQPVLAANGGSLVARIRRLIDPSHSVPEAFPGRAAAATMAFLCLAGAAVVTIRASQPASVALVRARIAGFAAPAADAAHRAIAAVAGSARHTLLYDPLLSARPLKAAAAHPSRQFRFPVQAPPRTRLPVEPPAPDPVADPQTLSLSAPLASLASESPRSFQPSGESASIPVFHSAARLVQLDVVARKHGMAVPALTKDDFTVLDDGQPQRIVLFSSTSQIAAGPDPVPLAPGTVSNRLEPASATPANATVLLIDQRNTPQADQAFVMQRIVKFLETRQAQGGHPDRIALYSFGHDGSLHVPQELTDRMELLLRAARQLKPHDPSFRSVDPEDTNDEIAGFELRNRVMDTSEVLQAVARHLASVPGRKNLIWITAGFPVVSTEGSKLLANFNPEMEAAARALTNSNFAFYAVDALGLRGTLSGITGIPDAASARIEPVVQFANFVRPQTDLRPAFPPADDAMSRLAALTGGLAFGDNEGIEDSIQKALDDSHLGYTLGFYVPQTDGPAAWHRLRVKVNRPGIRVRYRAKYFVPGTPAPESELAELPALLHTPLQATELQLVAQSRTDESRPGFCRIHVAVDLHNVHLEPHNNEWIGAVDLSLMVEGSRTAQRILGNLRIPGDELAATLQKGLWLDDSIAVNPGSGALHVVAQDRATGAAGTLRLPLIAR